MLITGIRSKPVYAPLQPDLGGRYHLMVGHGVGGGPLLRVLQDLQGSDPSSTARTLILYRSAPGSQAADAAQRGKDAGAPDDFGTQMLCVGVPDVRLFDLDEALLSDFHAVLSRSLMGTRLYVAGPESFMGLVMRIALQFNLNKDEVRAEECGTLARRVFCIHCRAVTENVRTNISQCSGCNRWLVVRDHYSRRLAAYMGVMVDAEVPGELPPVKEVFL
jgi:dimethylamine monooxygenase subunit C